MPTTRTPRQLADDLCRLWRSAAPVEAVEAVATTYAPTCDAASCADLAAYVVACQDEATSCRRHLDRCAAVGSPHAADWRRLVDGLEAEGYVAYCRLIALIEEAHR